MTVDAPFADAPYMSTIWNGAEVVGETTSGDWGFRVNKSIALGVVKAELAVPGTGLEIEIFGARCKAVVHADQPLWDPENDRIRA
jgi:dimethylglycine dehydrogenase